MIYYIFTRDNVEPAPPMLGATKETLVRQQGVVTKSRLS